MRALAKMQLKQDKKARQAIEEQFDMGEGDEEDMQAAQEEAAILQRLEEEHEAELQQAAGLRQSRGGPSPQQPQKRRQPRRQGKRQGGQGPRGRSNAAREEE
jgi:hypothetical protein